MTSPREGPQRILIVGAGFIGSAIVREARRRGIGVRVISRSESPSTAAAAAAGAEVTIGDASDSMAMTAAVRDVDHVYYTVGDLRTGIGDEGYGGDLSRALPPLVATLEACATNPALRFTFLSSGGTVYGEATALPITEDHATEPLVRYGIMKLTCEKYVGLFTRLHGVNARIVRCANAYGEGQPGNRPQGVIAAFLHRLARGEPLAVFGDGTVVRDFIHVNDLADTLLALHAAPEEPRIVNIGTGEGTSLKELLQLIERVTGRPLSETWQPARAFDVPANVLDVTRLKSLVDFQPLSLQDGLRLTWEQTLASLQAETAGVADAL